VSEKKMPKKLRVLVLDLSEDINFLKEVLRRVSMQGYVIHDALNPEFFLDHITLTPRRFDVAVIITMNNGFDLHLEDFDEEIIKVVEIYKNTSIQDLIDKLRVIEQGG
jgi:hypothetical protein